MNQAWFVLTIILFNVAVVAADCTSSIDPTPQQTIYSFGASGAWWPNDLINFPADVQQRVGELLFSPSGLWLSDYRYNVGGGGIGVTSPKAVVPSFLQPDGSYDWTSDKAGITFLRMAQDAHVPYITFFVNSAPPPIALNGKSCGWDMTPDQVQAFATYLSTVVLHWREAGINITHLSPMNEPDNNRATCTQEGMGVSIGLRARVFSTVYGTLLNATVNDVSLIGDETSWLVEADAEYPLWLHDAVDSLTAIAVHNYDFPPDALVSGYAWIAKTASHGLPIRFTETCCSTGPGPGPWLFAEQYDPTIVGALVMSRYIWQFLTLANAQSFDWWVALSKEMGCSPASNATCATEVNASGWNDGLIYYDPSYATSGNTALYLTKRYWALRHFSHFIRPGATRFNVINSPNGIATIATLDADLWNILFINDQNNPVQFNLALPGTSGIIKNITQTTAEDDWVAAPVPSSVGDSLQLRLPAQSLVSIQFVVTHSRIMMI